MSDLADFATALRAVADRQTTTADLATIASFHARLRPNVICHPHATRALLEWIADCQESHAYPRTFHETVVTEDGRR